MLYALSVIVPIDRRRPAVPSHAELAAGARAEAERRMLLDAWSILADHYGLRLGPDARHHDPSRDA
jgi:hypothetical protein